ncbi:MAG: hypothetical protein WCK92_07145 [Bacteroidota bacterium]
METTENKTMKNRCCGGRRPRAGWIVLGVLGFTALLFLFAAAIMWLWNGLMPVIFHLGVITYWQAIGLAVLARLLFGNMHHGARHGGRRQRFGPWWHRGGMHGGSNDPGMRWSYYEQYWNEEGERSFNDYVKRKTESTATAG